MSSKKCPQCGMVNWAEAAACKRCGAVFGTVRERVASFGLGAALTALALWLL